jgi:hypothetical protein
VIDEEEQSKTLYAEFGAAMYFAQVFEYGVISALVALRLPEKEKYTRQDIDEFIEGKYEKTLGALLRHLRGSMQLSDRLASLIEMSLARRNYLAHRYFRERAVPLQTIDGRDAMIAELQADQALFRETDRLLTEALLPIREKHGVTQERGDEMWAALCAELGIEP